MRKKFKIRLGKSFSQTNQKFYTFRYKFKPSSLNSRNKGELVFNEKKILLKLGSRQFSGERANQRGPHSKLANCVLIFDKSRNCYFLEKIDTGLVFKLHEPKTEKRQLKVKVNPPVQMNFQEQQPLKYEGDDEEEEAEEEEEEGEELIKFEEEIPEIHVKRAPESPGEFETPSPKISGEIGIAPGLVTNAPSPLTPLVVGQGAFHNVVANQGSDEEDFSSSSEEDDY